MRVKLFLLCLIAIGLTQPSFSQSTNPKLSGNVSNAHLPSLAEVIDRVSSLENENRKLKKEVEALTTEMHTKDSKLAEMQKDIFGVKVVNQGLNQTLTTLKSDYNTFLSDVYAKHYHILNGVPGNGAGSSDHLVTLHTGTGQILKQAIDQLKKTGSPQVKEN